jgi:hypothetical protein
MPFGFLSEQAFSFAGIPIWLTPSEKVPSPKFSIRMFVVGLLSGSQFKTTRAGHAKLFTRRFSRQVSSLRPFANFRVNCESGAALVVSAFRGGVPGVRVQPSPPGRAVKALLRQRNVQDPILPFFGIRSGPNKHEFFNDGSNG